jgi:hypothetical protein
MLDFIDIKHEIEPLMAVVEVFFSTTARADRAQLLDRIRDQLEKLRAADEISRAELERFYERTAKGGVRATEAERAALAPREDESAAAKMLLTRILSLRGYLTDTSLNDDPEAHQLLQKAINIAVGYVAGYQNLRDQLIRFDAERGIAGEILRTRPVQGEIDHKALGREFMVRFPKIRAALAR